MGLLKETTRYKATIVLNIYAKDDFTAQKEAERIARMIDLQEDNRCYLESLHENQFGSLDLREVEIQKLNIPC